MGNIHRRLLGAAVGGAVAVALAGIGAGVAWADGTTVNPSVTASGNPGISSTVRVVTTTSGLIDLHFSVTQPANVCRLLSASDQYYCDGVTGLYEGSHVYPNWQGDLTITGYEAAGLTYTSANGGWSCTESGGALSCQNPYQNNYFKTFDVYFTHAATYGGDVTANLAVSDKTPTDAPPTSIDQCKNGGWAAFDAMSFKPYETTTASGYVPVYTPRYTNQGGCVSYVASGGNAG